MTRPHHGLVLTAPLVALARFSDPIANGTSGDGDAMELLTADEFDGGWISVFEANP